MIICIHIDDLVSPQSEIISELSKQIMKYEFPINMFLNKEYINRMQ